MFGRQPSPPLQTYVGFPGGIAVAPNGDVYISQTFSHKILALKADGVHVIAGSGETGMKDGPAQSACFEQPYGLCFGPDGSLYIADAGNHCIRMYFDGQVTTVAGKPGEDGCADGPALQALFNRPKAVAVGPDGSLYVCDSSNRTVRKIKDGVVSTMRVNSFEHIDCITVDKNGTVYTASSYGWTLYALENGAVKTVIGRAGKGFADGPANTAKVHSLHGICIGTDGKLYIAEAFRLRALTAPPGREFEPAWTPAEGPRAEPSKPVDITNSIDVFTDAEVHIGKDNQTLRLHRSLLQYRCPPLCPPHEVKQLRKQPISAESAAAFQRWIYTDELPLDADLKTLLGLSVR